MTNPTAEAKQYWGYLISADKSPSPKFEQLLSGIAHYISKHVVPWDVRQLTPQKLAAFYKLVGGNYDALFLESPNAALSFIYKSLGCFHSLQQDKDPFAAPEIPALTPSGFVRWQTVQLLLNPQEQVPYLQEAVKRFEILNPGPGGPFPKLLPVDCLPKGPDAEMCKWHERVGERLRIESEAQIPQSAPPTARPQSSRHADLESVTDSSIDDRSIIDASEYFQKAPPPNLKRPSYSRSIPIITPNTRRSAPAQSPQATRRRGSSMNEPQSRSPPATDYADGPTPTPMYTTINPYARRTSPRDRARPVSVESASSISSEDISPNRRRTRRSTSSRVRIAETNDHHRDNRSPRSFSAARSPSHYPDDDDAPLSPLKDALGRRHSSHVLASYDRRDSAAMPPPPVPPLPQTQVQGQQQQQRVVGSRASQTLSPPFFAGGAGRMGERASPTGPTMPPGGWQGGAASAPLPQGQFARGSWRSVPAKSEREPGLMESWRGKMGNGNGNGAYADAGGRVNGRKSFNGGGEGREREVPIEGVRFVEGVGGLDERGYDRDWEGEERRRRRRDFEREWESEREERRRERREDRRERRRSGGVEG